MTLYHVVESAVVFGIVAAALVAFVRRLLPQRAGGSGGGCGGCSGCGSSEGSCGTPSAGARAQVSAGARAEVSAGAREQVIAPPASRRAERRGD